MLSGGKRCSEFCLECDVDRETKDLSRESVRNVEQEEEDEEEGECSQVTQILGARQMP